MRDVFRRRIYVSVGYNFHRKCIANPLQCIPLATGEFDEASLLYELNCIILLSYQGFELQLDCGVTGGWLIFVVEYRFITTLSIPFTVYIIVYSFGRMVEHKIVEVLK